MPKIAPVSFLRDAEIAEGTLGVPIEIIERCTVEMRPVAVHGIG